MMPPKLTGFNSRDGAIDSGGEADPPQADILFQFQRWCD